MTVRQLWKTLTRKKPLTQSYFEKSQLPRVLGLVDLTALGVASTLGMGVYIMAGSIAKLVGPAASISFFIAGIAASLSALCYGEFAARVPKAGSAYVYSYVAVGEFIAFVVGWNLALENVIGTACVARALSGYIDSLFGEKISSYLSESLPMHYEYLSSYPDFFAFFIMVAFSCLQAFGVVISSNFNKMFTTLNLTTIAIVVLAGAYKANLHNWTLTPGEVANVTNGGSGGFLPYGFVSIFSGAAKCFYAYTGFDCVACTGEEAKSPQRNVPLALILTLIIAFVAYLGISASLTLMLPYYDQSPVAPFPYAFDKVNLGGVKWVVTFGALCALCACMVGSLYGTSRIIYSMANDGLLFKSLSYVNKQFETPLVAIAAVGLFTGVVSIFFDVEMLVDMSSIGTLSAYTLVSVCVLLLRYEARDDVSAEEEVKKVEANDPSIMTGNGIDDCHRHSTFRDNLLSNLFNLNYQSDSNKVTTTPTHTSGKLVKWMTLAMLMSLVVLCGCVTKSHEYIMSFNPIVLLLMFISALVFLISTVSIGRQPQSDEQLTFKVRFVPLIPVTSCVMNIALMMMLNLHTWIRFLTWMIFGFIIYFGYGIKHSKENEMNKIAMSSSVKHVRSSTNDTSTTI